MKSKINPYELGRKDYLKRIGNNNPYPFLSEKWALYNKGYNKILCASGDLASVSFHHSKTV